MKFAICNELFDGWDHARVCETVADAGYDGLELAPFTLAPRVAELTADQRHTLRETAADRGLEIVGLHWLLAHTEGLHLTTDDDTTRIRTGEYLVTLAELCQDLGGTVMVFGSPGQRSLLPGVTHEQALDRAAEVFRAAMPRVADCGVTLCIEPLSPAETDFVTTCAQGVELIARVGHPAFRLHLDVKAMSSETAPVTELIRRHAPQAAHFHANDPNLRGPGFGDVDFAPVFAALEAAGYDRWVSVEVFDYRPDPESVARQSMANMRAARARVG